MSSVEFADFSQQEAIFVLARVEEQERFRVAWREVCDAPEDETLPYVSLLYGAHGIGKSTLS